MKITINVDKRTLELLAVLDERGAQQAVRYLIAHAADGIRRPGSWERGWLHQVFGHDWEHKLEQDPDVHWYVRPRRK